MKQKFINWSKTGEAKSKYGADALVIDQETKFGVQSILMEGQGGKLKYESVFNGGESSDDEVEPSKLEEYDDFEKYPEGQDGDQAEQDQEMSASQSVLESIGIKRNSKEDKYLELAFGKIVNGKGSFLKGLAKTTGLKFAYEVQNEMKKFDGINLQSLELISGLKEQRIKLRDDLRELGIKQTQFYDRKGLREVLNTLKRKGELKELQRLIKFNLDFNTKGANTLIKLMKFKNPKMLNKALEKKGLKKQQAKQLIITSLMWRQKKGKKKK